MCRYSSPSGMSGAPAISAFEVFKLPHGGSRVGAGRKPKTVFLASSRPSRPAWYCVRTDMGCEKIAFEQITAMGFEVLYPRWAKPAQPAYRAINGRRMAARPLQTFPLFRRYLFVRFDVSDLRWRYIVHLPGVDRVFSQSTYCPIEVPELAIQIIRGQCDANSILLPYSNAEPVLQANVPTGASLLVTGGAFDGLKGLCASSGAKSIDIETVLFGRPMTVTVKREHVSIPKAA